MTSILVNAAIATTILFQTVSVFAEEVDLRLVLATDVSGSISHKAYKTQRDGIVAALGDAHVQLQLASAGPIGKVAITYVEWAGHRLSHRILVPWMVLHRDTMERDVDTFLAALLKSTDVLTVGGFTAIGSALQFIRENVLEKCPYRSARTVIDMSGDGPNNAGPEADGERDVLTRDGDVTINGIVLVGIDETVDSYYEQHVIGGPGAFILKVEQVEDYDRILRRKLITEIAWR